MVAPVWRAAIVAGVLAAPAAAQGQIWIHQLGTPQADEAAAAAPDGAGGVYFAGYTRGSLFAQRGHFTDAWLVRYDRAGAQTWSRQFVATDFDSPRAAAPAAPDGVFLAGIGNPVAPYQGSVDAWIARFDGAGSPAWVRQIATPLDDWATAAAPAPAGGAYVAGHTAGSLFGPGAGGDDAWLARYDSAGGRTWGLQFGTGASDRALALAPDGAGGVFIAGETAGGLGGSPAGAGDAWLARYDRDGNRTWILQPGTVAYDAARALALDGTGGVYVTGSTEGNLGGSHAGSSDPWVARYDSAGRQVWVRQFGTAAGESAYAAAPDGAGGVYLGGVTTGGSLFGTNAGGWDAWIAHYTSAGGEPWGTQGGSGDSEWFRCLAPDDAGGVFAAGPTGGSLAGPNAGGLDAWLARFGKACYPDCDGSTGRGTLDIFDFLCFQNRYDAGEPHACDCDGSTGPGICDIFDFLCFQNAFAAGCT